jgi:acetyl-CoA carboxylase biotin carboxylase subunit
MSRSFKRVLVANRGEIAVRVCRTLREMGISPVAVFSDVDRDAPHVRAADLAFPVGPAPARDSYLRAEAILEAARLAGADAIHPGYGFLSENADFAEAVARAGIVFVGPPVAAMRVMSAKTTARAAMERAGVPVVPGSAGPVNTAEEAKADARRLGYPVMLKAAAGGGGKGMRAVLAEEEMEAAFRAARSEARGAFGDDTVYLEKGIVRPRHVEIQVMSGPDSRTVWLGERECSMQRRHQKVVEETPSPAISAATRAEMGRVAVRAAESVGYVGAGTVEFLVDASGAFYFLEMNTRLQVEHPVTELCCGVDLVEAQVRVAQGERLPWAQEQVQRRGHAVEARVYAEDPLHGFLPRPGRITELELPHGPGVRVDCGVSRGFDVPRFYDPMIAKVAAWAEDRERARRRLDRALAETVVKGIVTNTAYLRVLLNSEPFRTGVYDTSTALAVLQDEVTAPHDDVVDMAVAAAAIRAHRRNTRPVRPACPPRSRWRSTGWRDTGGTA